MLRVLALLALLVALGFWYEEFTGNEIGIKRSIKLVSGLVLGEYGVSTGGATGAADGVRGVGGSIGRMFGN